MKTPTGYRNIEDIRAGDKVLSYNETTKRLEVQTVAQTFIRKTDRIYTLVYDTGTKLQTTATHPFYIEGKGWVKAADLHVGDDALLAGEVSPLDIYGGARIQNVSYRQSKQGVIVVVSINPSHAAFSSGKYGSLGLAKRRSTVDQEAFLPWVGRAVNLFQSRNAYDLHCDDACCIL